MFPSCLHLYSLLLRASHLRCTVNANNSQEKDILITLICLWLQTLPIWIKQKKSWPEIRIHLDKSLLLIRVQIKLSPFECPGLNIDHISTCCHASVSWADAVMRVRGVCCSFDTWPKGAISLGVILISTLFFLFISVGCCFQGWRSRKCQPLWMWTVLLCASLECTYSLLLISLPLFLLPHRYHSISPPFIL